MARLPQILFPQRSFDPLRALVRRVAIAVGILGIVTLLTWLGRHGYRDIDGSAVTLLDAFYYSSVTLTTTGYGDITPVSPEARAIAAFVITPARILFLIALVGTTLELLTERFRAARAEARWRATVTDHTIIVGYGTKGRGAIDTLLGNGAERDHLLVIDPSGTAVTEAREAGFTAIQGDATRTTVLQQARVDEADVVIVTPHTDDTATLITLTARELNPTAVIVAAVREAENAHLLRQSGADTVIVSAEASGRLLGLSTAQPSAVSVLEDLINVGEGLDVCERSVRPTEVGGPPVGDVGELPIALVRGGQRLHFGDPEFLHALVDDVVVSIVPVKDP